MAGETGEETGESEEAVRIFRAMKRNKKQTPTVIAVSCRSLRIAKDAGN